MEQTNIDFDKFADLVVKAKGPHRTMQQFAVEIGTTPSTLSRIINKKNTGASAESLLKAIAEHADPESGVTFDMLMGANGKADKQLSRSEWIRENEQGCIKAIENSLRMLNVSDITNEVHLGVRGVSWFFDFAADVEGIGKWCFDIKLWDYPSSRPGHLPPGFGNTRQWIMSALSAFYISEDIKKVTLVVQNRSIFEQMAQILSEIRIKDVISVALVNREKEIIVAEACSLTEDGFENEPFFKEG